MDNLILFFIIFIILFLFFIINIILKRNIENYGVFCGRYNFEPSRIAMKNCKKDFNCTWQSYTDSSTGRVNSWCTNTPSTTLRLEPNISDLKLIEEEASSGPTPSMSYVFTSSYVNGTQLKDASTSVYDANLLNGPTVNNPGPTKRIYSISFNANSSQYVGINPSTIGSTGLSYACWIKVDPSNANFARIFDFANGASNDNIIMYISNGALGCTVYLGSAVGYQNGSIVSNIDDNIWYFIVWTLSSSGTWNIYVNGDLSQTYTAVYPNVVSRAYQYLAKSNWSTNPYFTGSIANFSVYNSVLSSTTVTSLYS